MEHKNIPYIAFEAQMARMERINKRLWVLLIILIAIILITNGLWLWYESQFEYFETQVVQENGEGDNNYIGNDGDFYYGKADGYNEGQEAQDRWE